VVDVLPGGKDTRRAHRPRLGYATRAPIQTAPITLPAALPALTLVKFRTSGMPRHRLGCRRARVMSVSLRHKDHKAPSTHASLLPTVAPSATTVDISTYSRRYIVSGFICVRGPSSSPPASSIVLRVELQVAVVATVASSIRCIHAWLHNSKVSLNLIGFFEIFCLLCFVSQLLNTRRTARHPVEAMCAAIRAAVSWDQAWHTDAVNTIIQPCLRYPVCLRVEPILWILLTTLKPTAEAQPRANLRLPKAEQIALTSADHGQCKHVLRRVDL
jgi:hypothetical protein